jgi:hypothetical protein
MKFGWLKKVGIIAAKVGAASAGINLNELFPRLPPVVGKIQELIEKSHLHELGTAIIRIEGISAAISSPLPGPEKLKAVTPEAYRILVDFLKMRGLKIENEAEVEAASQDLASAMVRAFNACREPED